MLRSVAVTALSTLVVVCADAGALCGHEVGALSFMQVRTRVSSTLQDELGVDAKARGNFSQECKLYPHKRVVLVTVNSDFVDMFKNWLHFAKPHLQSTEQLRVVAEDEAVVPKLEEITRELGSRAEVVSPTSRSSLLQLQAMAPYDTKSYGSVVWERPTRMLEVLDAGCSVLYSDIDTAWVKDPFGDIEAAGHGDLYLTDDNPVKSKKGTNFCTCFMYVHPGAATTELLQNWRAGKKGNLNQPAFNGALRSMRRNSAAGLSFKVLPAKRFPPGKLAKKHPGATVFHANWVRGIENKMKFFKERQLWVVP